MRVLLTEHLGLSTIRTVDFTQLHQQHILFFRAFFRDMIKDGTACYTVVSCVQQSCHRVVYDCCFFPVDARPQGSV